MEAPSVIYLTAQFQSQFLNLSGEITPNQTERLGSTDHSSNGTHINCIICYEVRFGLKVTH